MLASLVVVLAAGTPDSGFAQVSGTVREQSTGGAVVGALVSVQAAGIRTLTDEEGRFSFPQLQGEGLVIVGAAKGYFNRSALASAPRSGLEIVLSPVPPDDDPTYLLYEPGTCGKCHPEQEAQWTGSAMHLAGVNTWVHDFFDGTGTTGGQGGWVYTRDSVHAPGNPESECASCHQPESWIDQPFRALEPLATPSDAALHGVSCEICHKIGHVDESRINFPGIYPGAISYTRPSGPDYSQVEYGVLGDTDFRFPLFMRSSYQPQLTAAVCGSCHQDKNDPDQDGDFEEENGVTSEPTYLEWRESPYGDPQSPFYQTCVDCHMPSYGATRICTALTPPLTRDPSTIRSHRIEGTTPTFLENALELEMDVSMNGDRLAVEVRLRNQHAGHDLPTGVTIRNVILLLEAWSEVHGEPLSFAGNQVIGELGGVGDPADGYFAGLPGKLYARLNHDLTGNSPVFFTEATGIQNDTCIPALSADTTRYFFLSPEGGGTVHVRARAIYRRAFRATVDQKGWTLDGHGRPLEDLTAPHFGHLMEQAEWIGNTADLPQALQPSAQIALGLSPSPASASTRIVLTVARPCVIRLGIYDVSGRLVCMIAERPVTPGRHDFTWSAETTMSARPGSGIFFVRLETDERESVTRRLVIVR
ncbi:MAG: hypothetical protein IPK72_10530 [Candidatus Eisenbacteria bacterium]|nr:hypothetical protein [Candidatus Eisenbacteria bacterium]